MSAHSVQQRVAFAYVSYKMFCDHPLTGVGFGRFVDRKLPYLTDRTQAFELESIRPLEHHNTFLCVLTENGMIGLFALLALLGSTGVAGWRLYNLAGADDHVRAIGLLMIGALAVYVSSGLFHDLALVHSDQWLLFLIGGATIGALVNPRPATSRVRARVRFVPPGRSLPRARVPRALPNYLQREPRRVWLFGMRIDRLRLGEAARQVFAWATEDSDRACRYVVTPNVDHAVMFQEHEGLRDAYRDAAMVVADGAPLVAASRWLGKALPERVAGSDLAPRLLDLGRQAGRGGSPLRVFLLGAGPGVAERAAANIRLKWPGVEPVGVYCPPLGFEKDEEENDRILAAIAGARPDVLLVGLGAPKQELWVHAHHDRIEARVALCIGATIDFLAGERRRSPEWMQRMGLEWLHRLLSEPRRLARRYARDAWVFPQLIWSEYRGAFKP